MRAPLITVLTATLALSACSTVRESRINPLNWFGGAQETRVTTAPTETVIADPRPLVPEVASFVIEPTPGGAILRATGLPPRQGFWNGTLVPVPSDDPTLATYDFRVTAPLTTTATGPARAREITVGLFLSDQDLAPVRQIVIRGAQNQRSMAR